MSTNEDDDILTSDEGDFGVRDDGSFRPKDVADIQESLLATARQEFGNNIDLSPGSPARQLVDLATIELADVWHSLEGTYYASYFEDAFGIQLDRILALAGVGRLPRRGATGEVIFSTGSTAASQDIDIPRGTEVTTRREGDRPAIPFKTTEAATIQSGNTQSPEVPITALEPWEATVDERWLGDETNVASETITRIATPISGVREVTNPLPTGDSGERDDGTTYTFRIGRDRETDAELKTRYENSLASGGKASLQAIRSNVYTADSSVAGVGIEENNTMQDNTGSGGLPPKSFRVIVLGGFDQNVAQAILDTRSAGIESYGSESAVAELDDGTEYVEHFDRATDVQIYIDVSIQADETFPSNGDTLVEDNILRYIGGMTSTGTNYAGTDIGEDVMYDVVFGAVMNVRGTRTADVTIGTADDPTGTTDVVIAPDEIARTGSEQIDVTFDIVEVT